MKATYTTPVCDVAQADANILADSLQIYNFGKGDGLDIDDYTITDGSQILAPERKSNLWDVETEEE